MSLMRNADKRTSINLQMHIRFLRFIQNIIELLSFTIVIY